LQWWPFLLGGAVIFLVVWWVKFPHVSFRRKLDSQEINATATLITAVATAVLTFVVYQQYEIQQRQQKLEEIEAKQALYERYAKTYNGVLEFLRSMVSRDMKENMFLHSGQTIETKKGGETSTDAKFPHSSPSLEKDFYRLSIKKGEVKISRDAFEKFDKDTSESDFLFNEDVNEYIRKVRAEALMYLMIENQPSSRSLLGTPGHEPEDIKKSTKKKITQWLMEQLIYDIVQKKFEPYLTLDVSPAS
jgi:hypothetical protein